MDTKKLKEAARESSRLAGYVPSISADQVGRVNYECGFRNGAKWREEQGKLTVADNVCQKDETPAWAARDRNGGIYLYYTNKPVKREDRGVWLAGGVNGRIRRLNPDMLPQVKWEDPSPTKIIEATVYRTKEG